MLAAQARTLESFHVERESLEGNVPRFNGNVWAVQCGNLDAVIAEISSLSSAQETEKSHAKALTQQHRGLRRVLVTNMLLVARIGAAYLPGSKVKALRMPRGRPSAERLATLAHVMADAASAFSETFIAAGLAPDFAEQMHLVAEAMLAALSNRRTRLDSSRLATAALQSSVRRGHRIVAVLHALRKAARE
jgi:hypothetical protein